MRSFSYMRILALYNRAKNINAAWSLIDRATQISVFVIGIIAAMIASTSPAWHWYWDTFSWAGIGIAFLVSCIGLSVAFFLSGLGVHLWRRWQPMLATSPSIATPLQETTAPSEPLVPLHMALSVGSFSADFTKIKELLRFDISLVLFNHRTDKNIAIQAVHGKLAFENFMTMAGVSLVEIPPVKVLPYQHYGVTVTIRQGVNNEEKERICEILVSGGTLILDFDVIRFFVREAGGTPEDIKIHNLTRITCRTPKGDDIICGGWTALSGGSMR
jgi:hypothetical protein